MSSSWGTLEELLLACAVMRHGTQSWDSVANELQSRSSNFASFTPQSCRQKYYDIRRRFMNVTDGADGCDESDVESLAPMVDELKKLRVEELRRELQRRDVSIMALQLKVKRLEEEREQSLKENDKEAAEEADLTNDQDGKESERERRVASTEKVAGKSISGADSDNRENGSYNESNSTNQKGEVQRSDADEPQVKGEPVVCQPSPVQTESRPAGDWSNNSGLETVAKRRGGVVEVGVLGPAIPAGGIGESNALGESVAESKREGKQGTKQSSDVQSSPSLSIMTKRRRGRSGGFSSSGEEEPQGDEVSPATKLIAVKSEPSIGVLEIIRSHKLGSVFERRLRSQETEKYWNLIRQHMDLEMVQSRLEKGVYSDCPQRFFRDLILLFTNGVIFFRGNSPEYLAAHELRALVLKEMANIIRKPASTTTQSDPDKKPDQTQAEPNTTTTSSPSPTKTTPTMVVCRKRSYTRRERGFEEKPKVDDDRFVNMVEEKSGMERRMRMRTRTRTRTRMRESPVPGRRSLRTRNKNGESTNQTTKHECGNNVLSSHDDLEAKIDSKDCSAKMKHGVVSFLKRMKQKSTWNNKVVGGMENVYKVSEEVDRKDGKGEKKTRGRKKSDGRRVDKRITRSSGGGGKEVKEGNGQVKRRVGRPRKRQAATAVEASPPSGGAATSGGAARRRTRREVGGDSEVVAPVEASRGRPRKRSRR